MPALVSESLVADHLILISGSESAAYKSNLSNLG